MATPDVRRALKVSGRICWDPTSLSGTYPFGGTALGLVRGVALRVRETNHVIRAEEFGGVAVDAIYAGEEYVLAAVLSSWDVDAVAQSFLDHATGATTARPVIQSRVATDAVRSGALVSDRAGILYFAPDSDQHPGVLFRKALPMRQESAEWAFNLASEFGIPHIWLAVPDDDGEIAYVGLRQDLAL